MGRQAYPPWGIEGGKPGATSASLMKLPTEDTFKPVNLVRHLVPAGTAAVIATAGGGGWGDPLHRDPQLVRQDVIDGYVTIQSAALDYGVVIDPQTLEIDASATGNLRGTGFNLWVQDGGTGFSLNPQKGGTDNPTVHVPWTQELVAQWVKNGRIGPPTAPASQAKIDRLTSAGANPGKLSIGDLIDRKGMLTDVRTRVPLMNRDVRDLTKAVSIPAR
jgi:hypothetical protein